MTGTATPQGGYDPGHFESLFAAEDRHFWFRARNQVISAFARQLTENLAPGFRVLEMGCGDGNVLRFLSDACPDGTVVGMDLYGEGIRYARSRTSCPLVQGDVRRAPFGKQFQLIGIFDVLEHIPDDLQILRDLRELLHPEGALLLTVPAHQSLWSYFDELSGHCRRYSRAELETKLGETGYTVEFLSPYMASLHPLMWLSRKLRGSQSSGVDAKKLLEEELRVVPVLNEVLTWQLGWETRWLRGRRELPFGTSWLAIARRK
ncbi:MAG: class I SAM-dependent methyltransferase [Candidatus Solibacter sp.]